MTDKTAIIKEAQKYLAKGQLDKAITEWEKLIKESPDGNTYNTIGDLYLKKGDKKNAIESFHKAANFFRHEGFSLKSLALYKKVLNINPFDPDALYSLGELSEEKGLATDAIKYYLATADSLSKEGKKDRLLEIYEKILSLSPSNVPLRNKVAEIFLKEGLKSDAVKEYIHVARIYDENGDFQKAKEYLYKALDLQPLNKDAVVSLSYLHEKTGELDNAFEQIKEASVLFPEDVDVLLRCAELCLIRDKSAEAEKYLQRITEVEPENLTARKLLGEMYLKQGLKDNAWSVYLPILDEMIIQERYDDAIKILVIFKDTDPLETGKRLVSLYRQLGENDNVARELTYLGDALKEKGLTDEALSCYREAIEIIPGDPSVQEKIDELTRKPDIFEVPEMPEVPDVLEIPEFAEELEITGPETGEEAVAERISIKAEKSVEEIFTESDIFSRYGLVSEAKRLLEGLKLREPQNIELHSRLKSIYSDISDKESFVTECLILHELYKRQGEPDLSETMLQDAYKKYPEDPRLVERGQASMLEPTSYEKEVSQEALAGRELDIEDYEEEIAEADFYSRQGLTQEAYKILERLHRLFPDNEDLAEKLRAVGQVSEEAETELAESTEFPVSFDKTFEIPDMSTGVEETVSEEVLEEVPSEKEASVFEKTFPEEEVPQIPEEPEQPTEKPEYEEFTLTDKDLLEAQEMPEPQLDNDVLEIFQEFKKGLEKELAAEDSETHYNLGIAYKEMGLIDDAIKEFQTSRNDPKRFIQSSTMLGICYIEQGLYSLAIDALNKAIKEVPAKDESYWAIKYDLAEAHEKNNDLKESLDLYTEVYGWNAKYRGVAEKLTRVRAQAAKGGEQKEKTKERKDRVSYL